MKLFKKCPSCSFDKCWLKADICEKCEYSFKLGRKPRKAKVVVEDDEEVVVLPPAPVATHKICPDCMSKCWHAASVCEKCEYSFKTNESKAVREKRELVGEKEYKPEERVFMGYAPCWRTLPREAWMDEFSGPWKSKMVMPNDWSGKVVAYGEGEVGDLRSWCNTMMHKLPAIMNVDKLYNGALADYCESYTNNPFLKEATEQVRDWYSPKVGVTTKEWNAQRKAYRVMALTSEEVQKVYRRMTEDIENKVTVHRPVRTKESVFMTQLMLKPDEIAVFRETEKAAGRHYVPFSVGTLHWLPDQWNDWSTEQQGDWVAKRMGYPTESVPDKLPKAKIIKVPEPKKRTKVS